MSKVVTLHGGRPPQLGEPRQELVSLLESLLDDAKSGRLQSLIATGFMSDGCRLSAHSTGEHDVYSMLGALAWLQHEYVDRIAGKVEQG